MTTARSLPRLGWREWVSLPEWSIGYVKAKVDTGARTSSLHAFALERYEHEGDPWVRFEVHPWQRSDAAGQIAEARVVDERVVRSSSGDGELRPVIHATVGIAGVENVIELTLARRDQMGFRMLLGRQALRRRFVVDPGRSYLGGRPPKEIRRMNRDKGSAT